MDDVFLLWNIMYGYCLIFVLFKQKTAYEMRISDWSSDVCSSDLKAASKRKPAVKATKKPVKQTEAVATAKSEPMPSPLQALQEAAVADRKSDEEGKSVSVREDLGGRFIINHKTSHIDTVNTSCSDYGYRE